MSDKHLAEILAAQRDDLTKQLATVLEGAETDKARAWSRIKQENQRACEAEDRERLLRMQLDQMQDGLRRMFGDKCPADPNEALGALIMQHQELTCAVQREIPGAGMLGMVGALKQAGEAVDAVVIMLAEATGASASAVRMDLPTAVNTALERGKGWKERADQWAAAAQQAIQHFRCDIFNATPELLTDTAARRKQLEDSMRAEWVGQTSRVTADLQSVAEAAGVTEREYHVMLRETLAKIRELRRRDEATASAADEMKIAQEAMESLRGELKAARSRADQLPIFFRDGKPVTGLVDIIECAGLELKARDAAIGSLREQRTEHKRVAEARGAAIVSLHEQIAEHERVAEHRRAERARVMELLGKPGIAGTDALEQAVRELVGHRGAVDAAIEQHLASLHDGGLPETPDVELIEIAATEVRGLRAELDEQREYSRKLEARPVLTAKWLTAKLTHLGYNLAHAEKDAAAIMDAFPGTVTVPQDRAEELAAQIQNEAHALNPRIYGWTWDKLDAEQRSVSVEATRRAVAALAAASADGLSQAISYQATCVDANTIKLATVRCGECQKPVPAPAANCASHEWIGVDLDGTLAHHDTWRGLVHIGAPVPAMLARVKAWLAAGRQVRILTARVSDPAEAAAAREVIEAWCLEHVGQRLPVTCVKDMHMTELWDDRAVAVAKNTGEPAGLPRLPVGLVASTMMAAVDDSKQAYMGRWAARTPRVRRCMAPTRSGRRSGTPPPTR